MKPAFLVLCFLVCSAPAFATENPREKEMNDTLDVAAGLPLSVDDSSTQEYGTWSSQFATHFQHGGAEEKSFTISPEVQYGVLPNTEFNLTLPYTLERLEGNHGTNLQAGLKYNFIEENGIIPALAVEEDVTFPTDNHSAGIQNTVQFFATKHVLPQYGLTALYLNGSWTRAAHIESDDRRNAFSVAGGVSHLITDHTAIVADLAEQQLDEKDKTATLAELGFRQFINKDLILSVGTGTGLNHNAPDIELNAGIEYGF